MAELPPPTRADRGLSWAETKSITPTTLLSAGVGIVAGIIPGLGPTVASFLAYALAKRLAKPGERFGEGEIKGVAAAETADNAVVPASLIPLFALGLPGSVSAAIIIAAFTVHGVTPGPRMFEEHGRLMYGIYGAMLVASLLMLAVGRVGLTAFAQLARIPATVIIPTVTALCILGAYAETKSIFSVWLMVGFAVLGWVMHRYDYSRITFLIGFVVGPLFELVGAPVAHHHAQRSGAAAAAPGGAAAGRLRRGGRGAAQPRAARGGLSRCG